MDCWDGEEGGHDLEEKKKVSDCCEKPDESAGSELTWPGRLWLGSRCKVANRVDLWLIRREGGPWPDLT